jgi:hypothetical protein
MHCEPTDVSGAVPRRPSGNDVQRSIRFPEEWLRRAEALIPSLAKPGIALATSDVLRACLLRGLESFEGEQTPIAPAPKKPAKK